MTEELRKSENARIMCICGGGSLKASLARVFSLAKFKDCLVGLMAKRIAFTMAEILLSLTIIGVVAAITLPSLTGNINERTWNTQRKALFARVSQAVLLLDNIRGYGTLAVSEGHNGVDGNWVPETYQSDNAAEVFLTSGLSKVLKLNNICDSEHLGDCGLPDTINALGNLGSNASGEKFGNTKVSLSSIKTIQTFNADMFNTREQYNCGAINMVMPAAAFETANGESVLVYYNPWCSHVGDHYNGAGGSEFYASRVICANFVYDLNGKKGPNTIGKDMGFMSVVYPSDSVVVHPMPAPKNASNSISFANAGAACRAQGDGYRVPTKEELSSLLFNKTMLADNLYPALPNGSFLTSSLKSTGKRWISHGINIVSFSDDSAALRCIK